MACLWRLSVVVLQNVPRASPYEGREEYYRYPGVIIADVPILIERDRGHAHTIGTGVLVSARLST